MIMIMIKIKSRKRAPQKKRPFFWRDKAARRDILQRFLDDPIV